MLYAGSAGDLFETKFWCSVLVSYLPLVFEHFYLYIHTLRLNHVKISQSWVTYGWATQLHFMNFYQGAGDVPSCGKKKIQNKTQTGTRQLEKSSQAVWGCQPEKDQQQEGMQGEKK